MTDPTAGIPSEREFPAGECIYGYTAEQVARVIGERVADFWDWMERCGNTQPICEGSEYNPAAQQQEPTGCGPHGDVVFGDDIQRFLGRIAGPR